MKNAVELDIKQLFLALGWGWWRHEIRTVADKSITRNAVFKVALK